MANQNQNECRCEKKSCGCTKAETCTCGQTCGCQKTCNCEGSCGCNTHPQRAVLG